MYDETAMGQQAVSGWYPDPNAAGTLRYWDGSAWSEHTAAGYDHQAPAAGGYALPTSAQQWDGARSAVRRGPTFMDRNHQSVIAIGVSVAYLALAMFVGIVMLGIIPFMAGMRAVQRKEPLAPIAMVVAVGSIAFGLMSFVH